jgi:hypothetical protein
MIAALFQSLRQPENWKVRFYCEAQDRFQCSINAILDELTVTLADQVDRAGPFARELLRFRELLSSAEIDDFSGQVERSARVQALEHNKAKLIEF